LNRHEHSGVACAFAQARVTGKPAVCFGNPGPGITNLATGLLEAHSASLPVIALANGVPLAIDGQGAFQELDAIAHLKPVTKWAVRIVDPATTPWVMARAFDIAVNGRPGPVFIEVPSDIGLQDVAMPAYAPSLGRHLSRPAAVDVAAAARALAQAKRPLIWCGSGAVSSGAFDRVLDLAERLGAPVMTTPGGRGVIAEDHPLALGQTGLYFTQAGKAYHDAADLFFAIGTRLEEFSTGGWLYWPDGVKLVQLDIEPEAIALNKRPDVALAGDAALGLDDVIAALDGIDMAARETRMSEVAATRTAYLDTTDAECAEHLTPIRTRQVMHAMNQVFGHGTIICHENGGADLWSYYWPYYTVLDAGCSVPMGEQTAMGIGIIGTIGAKQAAPDKNVVCVTGDGAAQMAMLEFATAAEQKCGVTWVVLNNKAFGWPQYGQILIGQQQVATNFLVAADLVAIAHAQGCQGEHIDKPGDVMPALERALAANKKGVPYLLDIAIEKHDYPPHFVAHHEATMSGG
jgi:acetolactate synthase-1/2/3 large subunit